MKSPPDAPAYAGFVSRLIAFCIDLLVVVVVSLVVVSFAEALLNFFTIDGIVQQVTGQPKDTVYGPVRTAINIAVLLFPPVFAIAYPIVFWSIFGATPGMMLMGLYVRRIDGRRLTFWRALLRWFGSILSAIPVFLGFVWIAVDARRQGWNDKLADTIVVFIDKPAQLAQAMSAGRGGARQV